ncbi:MAG TPA: bifunctional oligoribonuclease/PAP phosphatase NrnA [Planctomycetota bacterium]|nr:bifunctional oligoribonuclease/PAP phosphatase NrnA [Planctomycetota bacterium]
MRVKTPVHRTSASTKRAVKRILAYVRRHDNFLVSGHVRSDGDALGSQLAFHHMLRKLGKKSHVVCDKGVLKDYAFLPGSEDVGAEPSDLHPPYGAVVTFDSGAWSRLERISAALNRKSLTVINVDHHASNERFGDINWIDPSFSSSGEMAWELVKASGVKVDRAIALNIYTAIVTDTGRFAFSNTTPETFLNAAELAGAGAKPSELTRLLYRQKTLEQLRFQAAMIGRIERTPDRRIAWVTLPLDLERQLGIPCGDTQEYIDLLMQLKETEIALLLREMDDPPRIKVSWRTQQGIDGIALAKPYGGGGHPRASGASLQGGLEDVTKKIVGEAVAFLKSGKRLSDKEEAAISRM